VNLAEYLERLVSGYEALYPAVPVRLAAEPVSLDLDRAVHLGLIVNELVTNALKHAFPQGRAGEVHVILRAADQHVDLAVRDNGVGWPPGVRLEDSQTLGLRIVRLLARRLAADATMAHEGGAVVRLRFPLDGTE
jgi:two-component sensor histidine kinase